MAAHEEEASGTTRVEREEKARAERRQRVRRDLVRVRTALVGLLASIIRWVGLLFAAVLVLYVVLTVGEANPDNGIAQFVHGWADTVSLGFKNLFTPDDPKLRVLVNYGIAAIFWLVVTSIVAKLLRRLG